MAIPRRRSIFLCRVAHLRAHAFGLPFGRHGECEYCEGGVGYEELMRSVVRVRALTPGVKLPTVPRALPMLQQPTAAGCSIGGCGSCGAH